MADQEKELNNLLTDIKELKEQLAILRKEQDSVEDKRAAQVGKLRESLNSVDDWTNFIKNLDDIPGLRSPAWYRVNIPFEFGAVPSAFGTVEISPTGPFVCKQIQMYFEITDTDSTHYPPQIPFVPRYYTSNAAGRTILSNSYIVIMNKYSRSCYPMNPNAPYLADAFSSYTTPPSTLNRGNGWNYPEFDVQIEIAGSNRFWTGTQKVPAAVFYGLVNPLYENFEGWVENTDRIVVHAHPTIPVHQKGVFVAEFHGYHINSHVDVNTLLGY